MTAVVDTYCVDVDSPEIDAGRYGAILSAEECGRAARFRFAHDSRRYVVRRGILRELIGSYLDSDPAEVTFVHNAYGKPSLAQGGLRFNLSHSHGVALYAFCQSADVGCDIERCDAKFAAEQIPERFFSRDEVRVLRALPVHEQTEAFFNCWTRKEAYIKAVGRGLSIDLDSFDVSLAPDEPAALRRGCEGWSVQSFMPMPGFQAAVVAPGVAFRLDRRTYRIAQPAFA